jgi:hypothetical protein
MTKTTAAAAATTAAPIANPCLCSTFAAIKQHITLGNGQPDTIEEVTGCTATTAREFAPGHDAKLKALLIRAGVAGWEVRQGNITGSAEKAAAQFAFAYMVDQGIARGRAKAAAKADRNAAKAERPKAARKAKSATPAPAASADQHVVTTVAAPEPVAEAAPATTRIKVGRWEYDATIAPNGDAHYTSGKGQPAVSVQGVYKLV